MHISNDLFFQLSPFSSIHFTPILSLFTLISSPLDFFNSSHPILSHPSRPGSSVSGHDESPGDHAATDAADPPAAGSVPPAAPGPAPAAAGCNAAAGKHTHSHFNACTLRQIFRSKHTGSCRHTHTYIGPCPIGSRLVCWRYIHILQVPYFGMTVWRVCKHKLKPHTHSPTQPLVTLCSSVSQPPAAHANSPQPGVLDTLTKRNLKLTHLFTSPLINRLLCVTGSVP